MKKVNKYRVIERLRNRFDLQDVDREMFHMIEAIHIITNADELLKEPNIYAETLDISGDADTWTDLLTVTENKNIRLKGARKPGTTASSSIAIFDGTTRFRMTATNTTETVVNGMNYLLKEEWKVQARNTGSGGDSSREFAIVYEEEDAY
jgi:hypothetical protein